MAILALATARHLSSEGPKWPFWSFSALAAARLEGERRQRRRGLTGTVVADHLAEPRVLVGPLLGVFRDLLARAADEVPPHDQLLLERLATEQQQPAGVGGPEPHRAAAGA